MFVKRRTLSLIILVILVLTFFGIYSRQNRDQPVFEYYAASARGADPPIFYVGATDKVMAITFDISWGDKTPDLILPILRARQQKATFFLSGPWSERHVEIVRQIVNDGHEIASHGHEHVNLSQCSREEVADNISRTHEILKRVAGTEPRFFRPPNGDYDDVVVSTARDLGYETIIWSVDSLDWKNPGVQYMVDRVGKMAFPGAIILFHASDSSKQTHLALEAILDGLNADGYTLVTLGDLMKYGGPCRDDPRGRPKPSHAP